MCYLRLQGPGLMGWHDSSQPHILTFLTSVAHPRSMWYAWLAMLPRTEYTAVLLCMLSLLARGLLATVVAT
jgi:hypothetical protein